MGPRNTPSTEKRLSDRYLHFGSFTPTSCKRGLAKTPYHRAGGICSSDAVSEESLLRAILVPTGYLDIFIYFHNWKKLTLTKSTELRRKSCASDWSVRETNDLRHRLSSAINRTFPNADIQILPTTRRIIMNECESSWASLSASYLAYQFVYSTVKHSFHFRPRCTHPWFSMVNCAVMRRDELFCFWLHKFITRYSSTRNSLMMLWCQRCKPS